MRKKPARVEVFLSHSSRDRRFTKRIADFLRSRGIRAWYSEHHIRGAQRWHNAIGRALARATHLLVILSPDSVTSTWVYRELTYALQRRRFDESIIPILYRSCDVERLSWTLSGIQILDFRRRSFEQGCAALLRVFNPKPEPRNRRKRP
jgi:hypothetical protein